MNPPRSRAGDRILSNEEIDARIYRDFVDAILERKLPPGTRLVEAPLCRAFGVTRGTLRRVFVKLAHEQIIELQPNRGAIVAAYDMEKTREAFDARVILEVGAVKGAARKATAQALRELRELVRSEHLSWEQRRWRDWIRESGEFHIQLAELNQNSIITAYLRTLIARTSLLISLYQSPNTSGCSVDVHVAILDAIERGDAEMSASLMQQHLGEYASAMLVESPHQQDIDFSALFSPV